jgi:hypothetical protein
MLLIGMSKGNIDTGNQVKIHGTSTEAWISFEWNILTLKNDQ